MVKQAWFIVIVLLVGTNAFAAENFVATLMPTGNSGSNGSGTAMLLLNEDETEVTYTITFSGLTGPELAAHIHRPDGAVAHQLPPGSPKQGSWQNLSLIDLFHLKGEQLYILIHTEANPGGELRGNITSTVPAQPATWGAIKAIYIGQSR